MDIVEEMRGFEADHEPDGWPAVKMKQVSALCDEIERLQDLIDKANAQDHVGVVEKYPAVQMWVRFNESVNHGESLINGTKLYAKPILYTKESISMPLEPTKEILQDMHRAINPRHSVMGQMHHVYRAALSAHQGFDIFSRDAPIPAQQSPAAPAPAMPMQDDQLPVHGNTIVGDATVRIDGVGEFICNDYDVIPIPKQDPSVSDVVEAVAEFVETQQGGPFDSSVMACAIRGQIEYGEFFKNITPSPRITEQDAREIIEDYIGYCYGKLLKPQSSVVMGMYIKNECTAILNKLNANAVAEVRQEPIGKICKSAECGGVDFYFDKIPDGETMLYAGPQPAQAAAMPEYLSAIEVLRENIRNPDRGVEYCGIFDNDKTRAAIGTLLSAAPKPE